MIESDTPTRVVLVADGSSAVRQIVEHTLTRRSMRVHGTGDGHDALRLARELRPDLILLDTVLPGLDGYRIADAIRAEASMSGAVMLLLAEGFGPVDEERALAYGAAATITKPFSPRALAEIVESALANRPRTAPDAGLTTRSGTEPDEGDPIAAELASRRRARLPAESLDDPLPAPSRGPDEAAADRSRPPLPGDDSFQLGTPGLFVRPDAPNRADSGMVQAAGPPRRAELRRIVEEVVRELAPELIREALTEIRPGRGVTGLLGGLRRRRETPEE